MTAPYLPQTIPPDFPRRWYVIDAVFEAVQSFIRRHPAALADEIQEVSDNAVMSVFRTEYNLSAVYA